MRFQQRFLHKSAGVRPTAGAATRRLWWMGIWSSFFVLTLQGFGDVLLREEFSYADGVIQDVSAGTWRVHSGTVNEADIAQGKMQLDQDGQDVNALLTGQPFSITNATALYAKFMVRFSALPNSAGVYFAHFKDSGSGFRARVWARTTGAAAGSFRLGISSVSGSAPPIAVHEADLQLNTDYTVVTSLNLSDGLAALWINPTLESDISVLSDAGAAFTAVSYAFRQATGIGVMTVDDLVVATSFDEALGSVTNVESAPRITSQPQPQAVVEGATAIFSVQATGNPQPTYQWQRDTIDLPGAIAPTLTLAIVTTNHAGNYRVVVSNSLGSVTSESAALTIFTAPTGDPKPPVVLFTNLLENLVRPGDVAVSTNLTEYALRPSETLTIQADITDPQGQLLVVRPSGQSLPAGINWIISGENTFHVTAMLSVTAQAADAGQSYLAQLETINASSTNRIGWSIYVPTSIEQQIVINEFLANPTSDAAAPHYNPLHRATPAAASRIGTDDEYIEIVNLSNQTVDLQNWMISDAVAVRHVFGTFDFLQSSNAVVVYGGQAAGSEPRLPAGVLGAVSNRGTAGLALNNAGDTIALRNAQSNLVARVVYPQSLVSAAGSLTRVPDLSGAFAAHAAAVNAVSPGTQIDGSAFGSARGGSTVPIKLEVGFAGFAMVVRWNAETNRTYSVLRAVDLAGPFESVVTNRTFSSRQGEYFDNEAPQVPHRFYLIRSP